MANLFAKYYFMVTTISTVGYGDIHPDDVPEYLYGISFIVSSLFMPQIEFKGHFWTF